MPRPLMYDDDINALRERLKRMHDGNARAHTHDPAFSQSPMGVEIETGLRIAHEFSSYFEPSAHPLRFAERCFLCARSES